MYIICTYYICYIYIYILYIYRHPRVLMEIWQVAISAIGLSRARNIASPHVSGQLPCDLYIQSMVWRCMSRSYMKKHHFNVVRHESALLSGCILTPFHVVSKILEECVSKTTSLPKKWHISWYNNENMILLNDNDVLNSW